MGHFSYVIRKRIKVRGAREERERERARERRKNTKRPKVAFLTLTLLPSLSLSLSLSLSPNKKYPDLPREGHLHVREERAAPHRYARREGREESRGKKSRGKPLLFVLIPGAHVFPLSPPLFFQYHFKKKKSRPHGRRLRRAQGRRRLPVHDLLGGEHVWMNRRF